MAVDFIIFFLGCPRIMGFEIGEVRRGMTSDAVTDFSGLQFSRRGRERRRFRQEHLQAGQFLRSKRERLSMKLELPICSVGIRGDKLERSGRFTRFDELEQASAVVDRRFVGIR
jgi:hypothetical protein